MQPDYVLPTPPAIYGEVKAGRAATVRKTIEAIKIDLNVSQLELAELLSEVREKQYHHEYGFPNFGEYVSSQLEMSERQAFYLIRITDTAKSLGIGRESLDKVNISKLKEIFSLDPEGFYLNPESLQREKLDTHIVRLVNVATAASLEQVKAEVKKLKGISPDEELTWLNIAVTKAQKETILQAFEICRRKLGDKSKTPDGTPVEYSDGSCLDSIAADFISDPNNYPEEV